MATGSCYMTTDFAMATQQLPFARVVSTTDDVQYNNQAFINASILLPTYEMMMDQINGNMVKFRDDYINYLNTNYQVNEMIAVIFRAVVCGTNVMLFIPKDEYSLYGDLLIGYINQKYMVTIGGPTVPFAMMPVSESLIAADSYVYHLIRLQDLFKEITAARLPDDMMFRIFSYISPIVYDEYKRVPNINDPNYLQFIADLYMMFVKNKHLMKIVNPINICERH